ERNHLPISKSVDTEIYSEGEEPSKLKIVLLIGIRNIDHEKNNKIKGYNRMKLVKELTKIFEPFNQATEAFSAERYPTLSIMYLVVKVLKSEFNFGIEPDIDEC
ncbi:8671_t:CDS:2, partial [Dentiscutata erythropus]